MKKVFMGSSCVLSVHRARLVLAFFAWVFFAPLNFANEDMNQEERSHFVHIAKQLRCPTCTGLSVLDSSAGFSEQIKDQVKKQIELGKSEQQILDFFVERYGPWILREPPTDGFNLIAWALPIALLVVGPFLIWLFVWRRRVSVDNFGVRSVDAIVSEMENELKALRES